MTGVYVLIKCMSSREVNGIYIAVPGQEFTILTVNETGKLPLFEKV